MNEKNEEQKVRNFVDEIIEKTTEPNENESNLVKYAKMELEAIGAFSKDDDFYGGMTGNAVLELIELFSKQGHSGMSASLVRNLFNKLADYKPLKPITCEDSEWGDAIDENNTYQNKRCSSIFKKGKNGKPYYLDAIVFRGENGSCFTGSSVKLKNGSKLKSRQFINLPFIPKTFYVDVNETEYYKNKKTGKLVKKVGGGWWESTVKDESQLKEIFEYYQKT